MVFRDFTGCFLTRLLKLGGLIGDLQVVIILSF